MDPHQGHAVALGPGFFFRSIDGGIALEFLNRAIERPTLPRICVSVFRVVFEIRVTLGLISRQKAYTIGEVFLGDVCRSIERRNNFLLCWRL